MLSSATSRIIKEHRAAKRKEWARYKSRHGRPNPPRRSPDKRLIQAWVDSDLAERIERDMARQGMVSRGSLTEWVVEAVREKLGLWRKAALVSLAELKPVAFHVIVPKLLFVPLFESLLAILSAGMNNAVAT
jgi:hypothetical protein